MSSRINLVQGDTRPFVVASLRETDGTTAIDLTGSTVALYFRASGSTTLLDTLAGTLLTGYEEADGTITTTAPYNVAGAGGRVRFAWGANTLAVDPGYYEGEVEITFSDTTVQTVYSILKFRVRSQF